MRHWSKFICSLSFGIGAAAFADEVIPELPPSPASTASLNSSAIDDVLPATIVSQTTISAVPSAPQKPAAPKPPVQPWKLNYFDNDFSYKKDPGTSLCLERPSKMFLWKTFLTVTPMRLESRSGVNFAGVTWMKSTDFGRRSRDGLFTISSAGAIIST